MRLSVVAVSVGIVATACGPAMVWQKSGATSADFDRANSACGEAAQRDAGPFVPPPPKYQDTYQTATVVGSRGGAGTVTHPTKGIDQNATSWVEASASARASHREMTRALHRLCLQAEGWSLVPRD